MTLPLFRGRIKVMSTILDVGYLGNRYR